jgi:hypothetical protein
MDNFYKDSPDGLIGNEDCGQMSAWYVLSALGIYPVTPGANKYDVGSPIFQKATINASGKEIIFAVEGLSSKAIYVEAIAEDDGSAMVRPLRNHQISHDIFNRNCTVKFRMVEQLNIDDLKFDDNQTTPLLQTDFVALPIIDAANKSFRGTTNISLIPNNANSILHYTLDGSEPNKTSAIYSTPININESKIVKTIEVDNRGYKSKVAVAEFVKLPNDWSIKLNSNYESIYDAGGAEGLIDGIRGDNNWRKGRWQGYQKQPLDAIIDLQKTKAVTKVNVSFLQDTRAWIVFPKLVEVFLSDDGINFRKVANQSSSIDINELNVVQQTMNFSLIGIKTRFVKIVAHQYGNLPEWHEGAGGDTHIFVDEIVVE